jgi:hypothetical protein
MCCAMAELDEPARQTELSGDGGNRTSIGALLQRIDQAIDETDEGGRVG